MDWNDTVTLLILVDTILNAKLLVAGYFLWRWWQRRKRVSSRGPLVHPEQPVQAESSVETVTTTNAEGTTWVGYGEREPE